MNSREYPLYIKTPVDIEDNASQEPNCRFYLKAKVKDSSKSKLILVIMMNPSKATKDRTDDTVFNILEHSYCFLDAKEITILNLYPFYEPNSAKVKQSTSSLSQDARDELMSKNSSCVKDSIKKQYDKVILAWGNTPKGLSNKEHKNLGYNILSSIETMPQSSENLYVYSFKSCKGLTVKKNPYHPSRKGKILGIQKIDSFSLKKTQSEYTLTLSKEYITNEKIKEPLFRTLKS